MSYKCYSPMLQQAAMLCCFSLIVLLSNSGCKPASNDSLDLLDTRVSQMKIDDLSRSMEFLNSERRFDQIEFANKVSTGFNRWVRSEGGKFDNDDWSLNAVAKPLADAFSELPVCQRIGEMSFSNSDAFYAQQCVWANQIATRVVESKQLGPFELYRLAAGDYVPDEDDDSDPLVNVVQILHPELNEEQAATLASGLKLFDWVVRNIQLEPDDNPAAVVVEADENVVEVNRSLALKEVDDEANLAGAGIPGNGYTRFAWQSLIYSRGDQYERARLFNLLARQVGLEVVMLTAGEDQRAWSPALVVGDQLFLFDTLLGLPLPGEKPGTIATLTGVKANPDLLKSLDLSVEESLEENTRYRVTADDVKTVGAMVLVSPESVSRRFLNLESSLGVESPVSFSTDVGAMIDSIPGTVDGDATIWDIEFKTHLFRDVVQDALFASAHQPQLRSKLKWYFANENYVDEFSVYRTSRCRFFRGKFNATNQFEGRGAIQSFYKLMYGDKQISELGTNLMLQRQLGIYSDENNVEIDRERRIASVQGQMYLVRRDAGLFLAQSNFDNGNIGSAANWLERRKDDTDAMAKWGTGISYLLARAYEGRGEYERAIEELGSDAQSTQRNGNLIRARLLNELKDAE